MQLGFIGLGRMGANMVRRLAKDGHEIVAYNRTVEKAHELADEERAAAHTVEAADTVAALVARLAKPRAAWIMVPAGDATEAQIKELLEHLEPGDTIGGEDAAVKPLEPVFRSLAPEGGYIHAGPPGAGHYVKMIHNGIEYGLMQAYAEGFEILHASEYDLDLAAIAENWMHGSVVRSWLLELLGLAYKGQGQDLEHLKGWVADSGEGRWTVQEAIDRDVPAPIITLALQTRFRSRQDDSYGAKVLAALRNEFGGHAVKST